MIPHDILTLYSAKMVEYVIAFIFLFLFLPFWKYVNGGKAAARPVLAARPARDLGPLVEWFLVPMRLFFHPGHAWARPEGSLVAVGADDFSQKLIGPLSGVRLPLVGTTLDQGGPAWTLTAAGKSVDMLSPVTGTVVEVNERVQHEPDLAGRDPYGEGWLLKIRAPRLEANLKQLLTGTLARRWIEDVCDRLRLQMGGNVGLAYQDGGAPVQSIARSLDPDGWDRIAADYFLTGNREN